MKVMVITCSPNKDGLTETCGQMARLGVEDSNGEAVMVRLNDLKISNCRACNNGWGTCRNEHSCGGVKDDFQELHMLMGEMDAYVVVTPVYWGEMSESAKAFFDRFRRCEALKEKNKVEGKPVISIAAAGGSGNGSNTCLASMERLFSHVRAVRFDMIGITRKNRDHMLEAIRSSAREMAICR
ncbi:MAG: flavodoxin family protein [Ruminiclostridium sp.]|nr:flavodoxin family protein [Ruminiclostridium sp.]